jgi:hypothetical protein
LDAKSAKGSENASAVRDDSLICRPRRYRCSSAIRRVAGNEREARSELERRLINQELFNYSILEIRRATSTEAASLDLTAGTIKLLN